MKYYGYDKYYAYKYHVDVKKIYDEAWKVYYDAECGDDAIIDDIINLLSWSNIKKTLKRIIYYLR